MVSNPRYDGKPLLRLLDVYVLWAIGELPPDREDGLKRMAPSCKLVSAAEDSGTRRLSALFAWTPTRRSKSGACGPATWKSLALTA